MYRPLRRLTDQQLIDLSATVTAQLIADGPGAIASWTDGRHGETKTQNMSVDKWLDEINNEMDIRGLSMPEQSVSDSTQGI